MRFLVGLDGSAEAEAGLDVLEALRLGATDEVTVIAVVEAPTRLGAFAGPPALLAWDSEVYEVVKSECRWIAESGAARLQPRVRAIPLVVDGHPVEVLQRIALERHADLLVVGPHGRGRLEELMVGSVSQGLLHWLRTPVLVARPVRAAFRSILLAVDGSRHALAAARFLARLPLPEQTKVTCLAVLPEHEGTYGRAWSDELYPLVRQAEEEGVARALDDAESALVGRGLHMERSVARGDAKRRILETAADSGADLIVLGARGLGGFESLVLGSVSRAVSKASTCSVLVVHAG